MITKIIFHRPGKSLQPCSVLFVEEVFAIEKFGEETSPFDPEKTPKREHWSVFNLDVQFITLLDCKQGRFFARVNQSGLQTMHEERGTISETYLAPLK